tara:strand:+ start:2192 stop:2395 length:204 start_codon:yes stop_codon:yes gene_type:complete
MILADKYRFYQSEVQKRKKEKNIDPNEILYLTENHMDKTVEADVMDDLGLTKICCRRHMLTHVDLLE